MRFTGSYFEWEMTQTPKPRREPLPQPGAPVGSPCVGCPYWRGIQCMTCYRELLEHIGR